MNERHDRIAEASSARFPHALSRLRIGVDPAPGDALVMTLARRHRLSVYDAAYLELARRRGVPLATLDTALAAAAVAEGLVLPGV